jgi:hypothetical protein
MFRPFGLVIAFVLFLGLLNPISAQKTDPKAKEDAPKPPAGWKEHSPRDGTYTVWIPEKANRQSERERNATIRGAKFRINALSIQITGGPDYVVEEVLLSPNLAKQFKTKELEEMFRDATASELGGKVAEESDVKAGEVAGKEYRIEGGKAVARVRIFTTNTRLLLQRVSGTKAQVDGDAAKTFIESGRFASGGGAAGAPRIFGGGFDSEFKDVAPEGGLLVGFEIGTAKVFNRDMIRSAKPIYRVGDKESFGEQRGTDLGSVVTLKAKPGYAVGAIAAKYGGGFDGMSVTFMKVGADGKLDPKDSYESDYVGTDEKKNPTKLGGGGTPVIGIVGKTNDKDMTGMGLLFKGQEGYEPKKK